MPENNDNSIYIYFAMSQSSTLIRTISAVTTCNYVEQLDGVQTLSFSALHDRQNPIYTNNYVYFRSQWYIVVRVSLDITNTPQIIQVECEHASFRLANLTMESFEVSASASVAETLNTLIDGTGFTVGTVEPTTLQAISVTSTLTKRAALMEIIGASQGNIRYNGTQIDILTHRGTNTRYTITDQNIISLSVSIENRLGDNNYSNTYSYALTLFRPENIGSVKCVLNVHKV